MTFSQSTGILDIGTAQWTGYAGRGQGKNNPARQNVANEGPLPRGWYSVEGEPFTHPACGQYCLRLKADPENEMFGRDGFLIHGDSINQPGYASHGCIIMPRVARLTINACGLRRLQVID